MQSVCHVQHFRRNPAGRRWHGRQGCFSPPWRPQGSGISRFLSEIHHGVPPGSRHTPPFRLRPCGVLRRRDRAIVYNIRPRQSPAGLFTSSVAGSDLGTLEFFGFDFVLGFGVAAASSRPASNNFSRFPSCPIPNSSRSISCSTSIRKRKYTNKYHSS
jgi:hypothetical protein